jgi:hypothetical protein
MELFTIEFKLVAFPRGSAAVPITLVDVPGDEYPMRMVAGSVGIQVTTRDEDVIPAPDSSGTIGALSSPFNFLTASRTTGTRTGMDTVQPASGWWLFIESQGATTDKGIPPKLKGAPKRK